MKTYVLTFSRQFPANHPRAGAETSFISKTLAREKQTTIRKNHFRWRKIAGDLKEQKGILSLRYWSDKPYRSKQIEFAQVSEINVRRAFITNDQNRGFEMSIDSDCQCRGDIAKIAEKEGLSVLDFMDWFSEEEFSGALIELKKFV